MTISIKRIEDAPALERHLVSLRLLLQHCVNDDPAGSSIGFLAPLSDDDATDLWQQLSPSVFGANPTTTFLIATEPGSDEVLATVQIARNPKQTHTYKGEIRKLLVHPSHRRSGLGRRMMDAAEQIAREELSLDMLLLDTATATPARAFYLKTGWTEWGICPEYAKAADGKKHDCSFFIKKLT